MWEPGAYVAADVAVCAEWAVSDKAAPYVVQPPAGPRVAPSEPGDRGG
jgi:hypothetical protein